jgi:hypothetical protein
MPILLALAGKVSSMSTDSFLGQAMLGQGRIGGIRGVLLIIVFLISCCCLFPLFTGLAYEEDMVGGYAVWAVDALRDAAIVQKTSPDGAAQIVGPKVSSYGWNDDFIIARQNPVLGWTEGNVALYITNWFIIEVGSGKVHGPLTEKQYIELRQTLGVPVDLTFTRYVEKRK